MAKPEAYYVRMIQYAKEARRGYVEYNPVGYDEDVKQLLDDLNKECVIFLAQTKPTVKKRRRRSELQASD